MTDHVTSLGSISTVLIGEFREALTNLLDVWFPRVLDREHGGFLCDFDYRWRPRGPQTKTLEFQARTLRALSEAAAFFPERPDLREMADAGAAYLRDSMWDREYGGFFRSLERSGTPLEGASKHGHGTSYAIAALVFHHRISGDEASLDLARRGFEWLDEHAHDERHGGYFGAYERDGRPILTADRAPPGFRVRDVIGTPFGLKDANTTCDLMAALASLYEASKDPAVLVRVEEIFAIVLTKLVVPPGSMHMFTHPDWTPVPDYARCGQSIHSANLLRDTARQLVLCSQSLFRFADLRGA